MPPNPAVLVLSDDDAAALVVTLPDEPAASELPSDDDPDPPAVAVGSDFESWLWLLGTQPAWLMLAKLGVAPVRSFSTLGPGSG